jgi:hypothetical protein
MRGKRSLPWFLPKRECDEHIRQRVADWRGGPARHRCRGISYHSTPCARCRDSAIAFFSLKSGGNLTTPRRESVKGVFPARLVSQFFAIIRNCCATTCETVVCWAFACSSASRRTSASRSRFKIALMRESYADQGSKTSICPPKFPTCIPSTLGYPLRSF